jgi:hypothetical protein
MLEHAAPLSVVVMLSRSIVLFHAQLFHRFMPIGTVCAISLLDGLSGFSRFETQQLRVDVREQFLLDGLTEHPVVKGIDHNAFFHQQQVPPRLLCIATVIWVVGA